MELKETLASFNRKERNWIVRDLLGESAKSLNEDFCGRITAEVRRVVEDFAFDDAPYWATDFHFDWLVGTLYRLAHPEKVIGEIWSNDCDMIQGNQEDVDLIIATGNVLLLIEVKGEGHWSNSQIKSKIERLQSMTPNLIDERGFAGATRIVFMLCSPRAPRKLPTDYWPIWAMAEGRPLHITLRRPSEDFLAVSQVFETKFSPPSSHWLIRKVKPTSGD